MMLKIDRYAILIYLGTYLEVVISGNVKSVPWDNIEFSRVYGDDHPTIYFGLGLKQCVGKCDNHGLYCKGVSYRRQCMECRLHQHFIKERLKRKASWVYLPKYGKEEGQCNSVTCPVNHVCNRQSLKCEESCPLGHYRNVTAEVACQPCDVGFYQDNVNNDVCSPCPLRTTTHSTATTSALHCIGYCPSGMVWDIDDSNCRQCPNNTYTDRREGLLDNTCRPCPAGRTTYTRRWGSVRDCDRKLFIEEPDFVSDWIDIASGTARTDVKHGLGEVPILVDVQVKVTEGPNEGFIFQGIGNPVGDDDKSSYGGLLYLYNDVIVSLLAPIASNSNNQGYIVYTGDPETRAGPNVQSSISGLVRVRAWRASSLPRHDFSHKQALDANSSTLSEVYVDVEHNFHSFPSLVIARTRLNSERFPDFYADTIGSAIGQPLSSKGTPNGLVISGYDNSSIRAWTCSSTDFCNSVWNSGDGYISAMSTTGLFEVYAWKKMSLHPMTQQNTGIHLSASPDDYIATLDINVGDKHLLRSMAQSKGPINRGFRFYGGGGTNAYRYHMNVDWDDCATGGLFYGFKGSEVRYWRAADSYTSGALICVTGFLSQTQNTGAIRFGFAHTQVWHLVHPGCRQNPCQNGGSCLNHQTGFVCECPWEWSGPLCETETNKADKRCKTYLVSGPFGVADDQLTASSSHVYENHTPEYARLHTVERESGTGAWSKRKDDTDSYIQVDFRRQHLVESVSTQGRTVPTQFVTSYRVTYSLDCATFEVVGDGNGDGILFTGNSDGDSVVENLLPEPVIARCVRIHPVTCSRYCSLRFDVSGCF